MLTKLGPALIITRREVRDQFRDWRIVFPVIALTVVFPWLMNFTANQAVSFVDKYGADLVAERLFPFLLMIVGFFPISVSLVIALESFVGEKERRSIEPLLSSPLSDVQLYLGKLLAAMAPPVFASYLGITVYLVGMYLQVGWKPEPTLLIQIILLTAVQVLVMVSGAVVISSQTTSVRAANLLSSFIIIPMAFLIQGESVVMFWAKYDVLWLAILGQAMLAGLLIRTGVSQFNREELLGRELDTLNVRWGWGVFKGAFLGQARSLPQWYRMVLGGALHHLALPLAAMFIALLLGLWAGASQASVLVFPTETIKVDEIGLNFVQRLDAIGYFSTSGIGVVWFHNVRAILLATVLGIFTFGVLGVIVLMLPMMLIGYIMASLARVGLSPLTFLAAFVLPHGIFEIPALALIGSAILGLGAALAAPAGGRTVGEAWLCSLADWAKILLGLVLPLLLVAALVEVMVTPYVATSLLGG